MKNSDRLFEFRIDRWDNNDDYKIIHNESTYYSVGIFPHFYKQYRDRLVQVYYKQLKLPSTEDELVNDVWSYCSGSFNKLASICKRGTVKGVYTQKRPVNIISDQGEVLFKLYLEVSVMYNASKPGFDDPELYTELVGMRRSRESLDVRNKFLRDNCDKHWIPYIDNGTVSDNKVGVFLETAIITMSEVSKYPASWTGFRFDLPRDVDDNYSTISMKEGQFRQMIKGIYNYSGSAKIMPRFSKELIDWLKDYGISKSHK